MNGLDPEAHLGKSVRQILGKAANDVEVALKRVLETGEPILNLELSLKLTNRAEIGHWSENYFPIKDHTGEVRQIGTIVVEVTQQRKLEESLHALTTKLLHAQDEEQRRIARDLHDSINQYHAAIKMNLARLNRAEPTKSKHSQLLTQSLELLEECISETRTLSYLLHPPVLDEMGFFAAVGWYIKGFGQRSGIQVNLTLPSELERLPAMIEVALFRVVQEALTNIHRHAHTAVVDIHVERTGKSVALEIRDYGCGILPEKLRELREAAGSAGVGIASMRERINELGGQLKIESDGKGTRVSARIPIATQRLPEILDKAKYA
jgi:signal transduction histidine kinase